MDIPVFSKLYEFYKNISNYLSLFPKGKRYTLGQKIDQTTLDLIELVLTAGYSTHEQKLAILQKASIKLDLLKMLIRLSLDTKCLDNKKYQLTSAQLVEIGKMLGGWIKSVRQ